MYHQQNKPVQIAGQVKVRVSPRSESCELSNIMQGVHNRE